MNRQKLFVIVSVFILLLAHMLAVGAQDVQPGIVLAADNTQVSAGQQFTVTVNIKGAIRVYGGSVKLTYDPQALEVVLKDNQALVPGSFFAAGPSFALKNTANATTGTLEYALTLTQPAQPVSGDGVLGTITFKALKDAAVTITPVEANFVVPVFNDVNGQQVAQSINQVQAQTAPLVITIGAPDASASVSSASVSSASVASASVSQPNDAASASVSAAVSAPAAEPQTTTSTAAASNNRGLLLAGGFFLVGLLLLIVSVGMYSKMRVRFSIAGDNFPEQAL